MNTHTADRPGGRARFRSMDDSTADDWQVIERQHAIYSSELPIRILAQLELLGGDFGGFQVDRLTHCLQTATRAERDGRDDQYVLCALVHDIGDILAPNNHAQLGAAVVRRFVSPELHWMVEHHTIFQGYHYFHVIGLDRNMRDQFEGHPAYDLTAEFCAEYDQVAFDPAYPTKPLDHFAPLVHAVMGREDSALESLHAGPPLS